MQFLVIGRLIDTPVAPARQEVDLLIETFRHFASREDERIKAIYPYADERATALLVEVETADELSEILGSLPASRLSSLEGHPVASPESVVRLLEGRAAALANQ
jgi:hypothetical protein